MLPLRATARRCADADGGGLWPALVAVPPTNSGDGREAFALLDVVARRARHSSTPSHAIGCVFLGGRALSVSWRLERAAADAAMTDAATTDAAAAGADGEVTRDHLRGRYMLETPLYRALQSLPLLVHPQRWHSSADRA
eukprot:5307647-Prymnesium_polylepis.1